MSATCQDCATGIFSVTKHKYICAANADTKYPRAGYCPFFKESRESENSRKAAKERAEALGYLDENGIYKGPFYDTIPTWLKSLVAREIITQEYYDAYCNSERRI